MHCWEAKTFSVFASVFWIGRCNVCKPTIQQGQVRGEKDGFKKGVPQDPTGAFRKIFVLD